MYAFEILGRIYAGLQLCGVEPTGELQWMGTFTQWQNVEECEEEVINTYEFNRIWK